MCLCDPSDRCAWCCAFVYWWTPSSTPRIPYSRCHAEPLTHHPRKQSPVSSPRSAGGRWPVRPSPKDRFGGAADGRPDERSTSGLGNCRRSAADPERQQQSAVDLRPEQFRCHRHVRPGESGRSLSKLHRSPARSGYRPQPSRARQPGEGLKNQRNARIAAVPMSLPPSRFEFPRPLNSGSGRRRRCGPRPPRP